MYCVVSTFSEKINKRTETNVYSLEPSTFDTVFLKVFTVNTEANVVFFLLFCIYFGYFFSMRVFLLFLVCIYLFHVQIHTLALFKYLSLKLNSVSESVSWLVAAS